MWSNWRKSSYSFSNGNCVEAASYRKSSFSEASDCIEAGSGPGPVLEFTPAAWAEFTGNLRNTGRAGMPLAG